MCVGGVAHILGVEFGGSSWGCGAHVFSTFYSTLMRHLKHDFFSHHTAYGNHDGSVAYFLLGVITRASTRPQVGKILAGVGALCLLHLGISFLIFDASRFHHPSLVTVSVVFSSAALMLVAPASSHVLTILSDNSLRFFGRISYALYLVHWPVFMFTALALDSARYSVEQVVFSVPLAVGAAWLLTERLENPIRFIIPPQKGLLLTGAVGDCLGWHVSIWNSALPSEGWR